MSSSFRKIIRQTSFVDCQPHFNSRIKDCLEEAKRLNHYFNLPVNFSFQKHDFVVKNETDINILLELYYKSYV